MFKSSTIKGIVNFISQNKILKLLHYYQEVKSMTLFVLALGCFMAWPSAQSGVFQKLDKRMADFNSLVCVGLDPDITKVPLSLFNAHKSNDEAVYLFLSKVIDITAPHVCCFKLQKAFYD